MQDRIKQMAVEAGLPDQITAHPAFKHFVRLYEAQLSNGESITTQCNCLVQCGDVSAYEREQAAQETARLDWLEAACGIDFMKEMRVYLPKDGMSFREALDHFVAMQMGPNEH